MDILERFDQVFAPLVKPSPQELSHAIDEARVTLKDLLPHVGEAGDLSLRQKAAVPI